MHPYIHVYIHMCMYTYYINYEYIYIYIYGRMGGTYCFFPSIIPCFLFMCFLLTEKHLPEIMHYLNQIGVFTDHSQLIRF